MKPYRISKKEKLSLLSNRPRIEEVYNGLECQHRIASNTHKDVETAIAIGRKFNNEVIRPIALEIDRKCMEDHNYLPHEFVRKAADWGLFSLFLPKMFGGGGLNFYAIYPFMEEISSSCAGLGHIVNVHYCGVATLFPSMNMNVITTVFRDVVKSERQGKPRLCTIVVTEPESGTDSQEPLLNQYSKATSNVKRVKGGYIVNGKKIFISSGHLSYWHIANFFEDKSDKLGSWIQFAVPNGTKGFSFGTHENKMGQLACCASELLFDDCFIPNKLISARALDPEFKDSEKGPRWVCHTIVDHVTGSSRTGTAAISTGIARNAYETALEYARKKRVAGELLINHQWAQIILSDMYRNVNMSRTVYMESAATLALRGLFKLLFIKPIHHFIKIMPRWYFTLLTPIMKSRLATWAMRQFYFHRYPTEERNAASGWGSACKYTCSDLGVINSNLAIDLMGGDGIRHDHMAEKCFRDIKLQQIYESTNQVNQMNMFYCLIGSGIPEVEYFK
ncbi:MAG: acyl-CoA/acyl-ACP dehydrogenase [Spirochaetes bacterium]|nr:acyl-CoA/acyl-ACP dehydrogenase [Spirochaetota bacterium]